MSLINFRGLPRERTDRMSSAFEEFFGRGITEFFNQGMSSTNPSVNVSDNDADYSIEVAAPGLEREDFSIDLKDNTLVVNAERKIEEEDENGERFVRREFNYARFQRQFQLPENVNVDEIEAAYEKGVLKISLPKAEEKNGSVKRIEIA